jgi:hypothetical protein
LGEGKSRTVIFAADSPVKAAKQPKKGNSVACEQRPGDGNPWPGVLSLGSERRAGWIYFQIKKSG